MPFPYIAAVGAAGIGMSIYDSAKTSGENKRYRKVARQQALSEIPILQQQKAEFEKLYEQRHGYITDTYGVEMKGLTNKLRDTLYNIGRQKESAARQTGLAYSGTIDTSANRLEDTSRRDYGLQKESLFTRLQSSLLESTMSEKREIGAIESQIEAAKGTYAANIQSIGDFSSVINDLKSGKINPDQFIQAIGGNI